MDIGREIAEFISDTITEHDRDPGAVATAPAERGAQNVVGDVLQLCGQVNPLEKHPALIVLALILFVLLAVLVAMRIVVLHLKPVSAQGAPGPKKLE